MMSMSISSTARSSNSSRTSSSTHMRERPTTVSTRPSGQGDVYSEGGKMTRRMSHDASTAVGMSMIRTWMRSGNLFSQSITLETIAL